MGNSYNILIVDDDEEDRNIFMDAIFEIDANISCAMAADGLEAIKMLKRENFILPDIIFLDLNMPRMDGKQFLIEKNKHTHLQSIPAVIYTTTKRTKDVVETKELGAIDFLTKPIKFLDICDELRSVIARVRQRNYSV